MRAYYLLGDTFGGGCLNPDDGTIWNMNILNPHLDYFTTGYGPTIGFFVVHLGVWKMARMNCVVAQNRWNT